MFYFRNRASARNFRLRNPDVYRVVDNGPTAEEGRRWAVRVMPAA